MGIFRVLIYIIIAAVIGLLIPMPKDKFLLHQKSGNQVLPLIAVARAENSAQSAPPLVSGSKSVAAFVMIEMEDRSGGDTQPRAQLNSKSEAMAADRRAITTTRDKLQKTIIPEVNFRDVTVREALKFLNRETGVPMVDLSGNLPSEKPLQGNSIEPGDARITLSLKNASAVEVLRYVTTLAGLVGRIEPGIVVIKPSIIGCGAVTKSEAFKAPPKIDGMPIKEFFASKGVEFPEAAWSTFDYNASTGCLKVANTVENVRRIEIILDKLSSQPKNIGTVQELTQELELRETLEWRLSLEETMVLNAEIHDAFLEEIVKELQLKFNPWVGTQVDSKIRVNLSMKNVPVTELLQRIAELTKTHLVIGLRAFVFVPAAAANP